MARAGSDHLSLPARVWRQFTKRLKKLTPRSLFGRSVAIMLVPLVLVQASALWLFYDRHYKQLSTNIAENVAGDVSALIFMMQRAPSDAEFEDIFAMARQRMGISPSFEFGALPLPAQAFTSAVVDRRLAESLGRLNLPFAIDSISDDDQVRIAVDLTDLDGMLFLDIPRGRLFSSTAYIFAFWILGASAILFGVATIFLRNQVRPIRRLARSAEAFGKGQEAEDLKPEGAREVRQATQSFRQMRDRIETFIAQRTAMLSGVSHDLRTPLTRMKLQLALMRDAEDRDAIATDIADMEQMIEGYLSFARGEEDDTTVTIDAEALVNDALAACEWPGRPVRLRIEKPDNAPVWFTGRAPALKRCLINLVTNAQKHGEKVEVTLRLSGGQILIIVDDDGPGIASDQREAVFQPFVRLDTSRNTETGGTGLGLTISQDIAQSHGGRVGLHSSPLGGLRAILSLPR